MENSEKRVHFIGIGGISMSALARHALRRYAVSGSDIKLNALTDGLARSGAEVYEGSDPQKTAEAWLVVYNSAIRADDPELAAAKRNGVKTAARSEYLACVASEAEKCIAVSGIHGKSTVTALLSAAFKNADAPFFAHVGAEVPDIGGNYYNQGNRFFITEACEYKGSFLTLSPDIAVILNVEMDHPDYYADEESVFAVFRRFAERIRSGGTLILHADEKYRRLYENLRSDITVATFGIGCGKYSAQNLRRSDDKDYGYIFDLYIDGEFVAEVKNKLYGRHNVLNALACLAATDSSGIDRQPVIEGFARFRGVKRRFEPLGSVGACRLIGDYAHHPSEIRALIASAREGFDGRIAAVFQPHTYSRTKKLFDEFCDVLKGADKLFILKEYPARETPDMGKSAYDLFCAINAAATEEKAATTDAIYCRGRCPHRPETERIEPEYYAEYSATFAELAERIHSCAKDFDCILIVGAGDIDGITAYL
ncbi:MAG: UDP-N-acetylmuramate--L-alanine ligase [Clostridiales bacterium]|jgi:UDP-N-acetylmuramate--alanine ligase|nr:UDP-N-acetylmuramate--L-alanine ligase [Clostridiales bacterium]